MRKDFRAYRRLYRFLRTVLFILYRFKFVGRGNMPKGAAVVCGNHSSYLDPILIAFAAGYHDHVHMMGKAELFKVPVLGALFSAIGSFPVSRDKNPLAAVKTAMAYLKMGEKVAIFPEGTRIRTEDGGAAKQGAVRIADQMNVPIVPVYIPRRKLLFGSYTIVVGQPYLVNPEKKKLSGNDYMKIADALMEKIEALKMTPETIKK